MRVEWFSGLIHRLAGGSVTARRQRYSRCRLEFLVGLVRTGCGVIRAVGVIVLGVKKFGYEMNWIIRRVKT